MDDAEREAVQAGTDVPVQSKKPPGNKRPGMPELDELKKNNAELNDRFLRLAADFENFKETDGTRTGNDWSALANERFAVDILEVMDNFERALKADDAHLRKGVEQIHQSVYCTIAALRHQSH